MRTQYSDGSIRAQKGMAAASKQNNELYRIKQRLSNGCAVDLGFMCANQAN